MRSSPLDRDRARDRAREPPAGPDEPPRPLDCPSDSSWSLFISCHLWFPSTIKCFVGPVWVFVGVRGTSEPSSGRAVSVERTGAVMRFHTMTSLFLNPTSTEAAGRRRRHDEPRTLPLTAAFPPRTAAMRVS